MKSKTIHPASNKLTKACSMETLARVRLVVSAMLSANDVIPRATSVTVVECWRFIRDVADGGSRIIPAHMATPKRDKLRLEASAMLRKVAPGVLSLCK